MPRRSGRKPARPRWDGRGIDDGAGRNDSNFKFRTDPMGGGGNNRKSGLARQLLSFYWYVCFDSFCFGFKLWLRRQIHQLSVQS